MPPLAKWLMHSEMQGSPKSEMYPLSVVSNHPKYRFHVQGGDISWIKELAKVRGPDGYMSEPCWIHPIDARGIADGDVIMVHNERGGVLCGAVVTERIIPGALSIDHGAKIDLAMLKDKLVDRGGSINMIAPSPLEKYGDGEEIKIPEMKVCGFLADAAKIDASEIVASAAVSRGSTVSS